MHEMSEARPVLTCPLLGLLPGSDKIVARLLLFLLLP
jgi:hypothetical protein